MCDGTFTAMPVQSIALITQSLAKPEFYYQCISIEINVLFRMSLSQFPNITSKCGQLTNKYRNVHVPV